MIDFKKQVFFKPLGLFIPKDKASEIKAAFKAVELNESLDKRVKTSKKLMRHDYDYVKKYSQHAPDVKHPMYTSMNLPKQKKLGKLIAESSMVADLDTPTQVKTIESIFSLPFNSRTKRYAESERIILTMNLRRAGILPKLPNNRVLTDSESATMRKLLQSTTLNKEAYKDIYGSESV